MSNTATATELHTHTAYGFTTYSRWLGRCKACKAKVAFEITADDELGGLWHIGHRTVACTCGAAVKCEPVSGRHSDKHTCGARCTNATGPDCECSCAGENHGANV